MEPAAARSFAAQLASLEQLGDEQLQILINRAQGILLDRVPHDQAPPLSVEIVGREEGRLLRAYRGLAPQVRSQVLRSMGRLYRGARQSLHRSR